MYPCVWVHGHCCLLSFRGNLVVICTLSNMIVLWRKLFIQKSFSKNGITIRNQKKILRKESWKRTSGTTKWDKLGQIGVRGTSGTRRRGSSDLSGTCGTRRRGSSDLRGTSGTRARGLSTWTSPLVPNGTTRPWKFPQVSSMGRLLFYRPVDLSRSISTVDADSPAWKYGRCRRSMPYYLLKNTVDIDGLCRFTYLKMRSISHRPSISEKNRSKSTVDVDSYTKNRSTAFFRQVDKKDHWTMITVFGKHCECIAQKCTYLERLPPLATQLLLLSHCVLTQHGGQKESHI